MGMVVWVILAADHSVLAGGQVLRGQRKPSAVSSFPLPPPRLTPQEPELLRKFFLAMASLSPPLCLKSKSQPAVKNKFIRAKGIVQVG